MAGYLWGSEPWVLARSPFSEASGNVGVEHPGRAFGNHIGAEGPGMTLPNSLPLTDDASGEQPCGPAASRGREL